MFGIIVQLTWGPLLKVVSFLLFNLIKKNIIERKVELLKAWLMSEVKAEVSGQWPYAAGHRGYELPPHYGCFPATMFSTFWRNGVPGLRFSSGT